jgi:hypothetical protein
MLGHSAISETALSEAIAGSTSITGTLATTNAADTLSASGGVLVSGTLATTNAADTLSASGGVLVSGTLAYTNAADTLSASGTVTDNTITGTLAYTNASDTLAASGAVEISGSLAVTNANDTASASGSNGDIEVQTVHSLRGGSGGGSTGAEYLPKKHSLASPHQPKYGESTPGLVPRVSEPESAPEIIEEAVEQSETAQPEPPLSLDDIRQAYRKIANLDVPETVKATRAEIEQEIALFQQQQAEQAALEALNTRITAILDEIRQEEEAVLMLLIMAAA